MPSTNEVIANLREIVNDWSPKMERYERIEEAARALVASLDPNTGYGFGFDDEIDALRAALAQPAAPTTTGTTKEGE